VSDPQPTPTGLSIAIDRARDAANHIADECRGQDLQDVVRRIADTLRAIDSDWYIPVHDRAAVRVLRDTVADLAGLDADALGLAWLEYELGVDQRGRETVRERDVYRAAHGRGLQLVKHRGDWFIVHADPSGVNLEAVELSPQRAMTLEELEEYLARS
jgi:hypothetical protein